MFENLWNTSFYCALLDCVSEVLHLKKKLKARPSTCKMTKTHFIAVLVLLWWSGTEITIFLRYAYKLQTGHIICVLNQTGH